ncbi:MAG: DUF3253 domain-containing protein [Gemmatimonadetes bacterium]|nr:DUF3253 domain-containing protein [Gemmatimonadota bacterium]NNL31005.1 DUF3253 domain-containing protein [Gemmatimonadota bacterium]
MDRRRNVGVGAGVHRLGWPRASGTHLAVHVRSAGAGSPAPSRRLRRRSAAAPRENQLDPHRGVAGPGAAGCRASAVRGSRGLPGPKSCASCGRTMVYRRRWARVWDEVKYCSARCRSRRTGRIDADLEDETLRLLSARGGSAAVCPSEAARRVRPADWESIVERARAAARRLEAAGHVEIVQGGRRVDPSTAKGPFRVRRANSPPGPTVSEEVRP